MTEPSDVRATRSAYDTTSPGRLPVLFAEFARVLALGGHLLLAFKVGDEQRHLEQAYGHPISLDVYWQPVERVVELAEQAGLVPHAHLWREAVAPERGPQGYVLARRGTAHT